MNKVLIAFFATVTLSTAAVAALNLYANPPGGITGSVRVIDGDTIEFWQSRTRVRLAGIDAPEVRQPCLSGTRYDCGFMATVHLMELIGSDTVSCQLELFTESYQRRIGTCWTIHNTISLNNAMVLDGFAMDYPHFSDRIYHSDEFTARTNKRGLWGYGGFDPPWKWRGGQVSYRRFH